MGELTISNVPVGSQLLEVIHKETDVENIQSSFAMLLQGLTMVTSGQTPVEMSDLSLLTESKNLETLNKISTFLRPGGFNFEDFKVWYGSLTTSEKNTIFKLLTTLQELQVDKLPLVIKNEEQNPIPLLTKEPQLLERLTREIKQDQVPIEANPLPGVERKRSSFEQEMDPFVKKLMELDAKTSFIKPNFHTSLNEVAIHDIYPSEKEESIQNEGLIKNLNIPATKEIKTATTSIPGLEPDEQRLIVDGEFKALEPQQFPVHQIQANFTKTEFIHSKPIVTEHLNLNQPFVDELGKVFIKNLQLPNGLSETKIQLHPQELGQIDVKLLAKDGVISAHILTESSVGKELLQGQIHQLKQALIQQGFFVEKIEVSQVTASSSTFAQDLKHGFHFSEQQSFKQQSHQGGKNTSYLRVYNEELEDINNQYFSTSGIDYTV